MDEQNRHLQEVKKALCGIVDKLDDYPTNGATRNDLLDLILDVSNELAKVIGYDGSTESIKRAL